MSNSATDPLAGLESIDWSKLAHAYGPADDVPQFLRDLRSSDPEVYGAAYEECWSTIYHQGSRYSASEAAVPFLYSLLDHPDTQDRENLLDLITNLAVGYTDWSVPNGIDVTKWEKQFLDGNNDGNEDESDDDSDDENDDESDSQVQALHEFKTYEAVERGLSSIIRCLEDQSPGMRMTAAHSLSFFPRHSETSVEALFDRLSREISSPVRGTMVLAIAILFAKVNDDSKKSSATKKLQDLYEASNTDELFTWSCAMALIILGSTQEKFVEKTKRTLTNEAYVAELESLVDPDSGFPFAMPDLRDLAEAVVGEST
ncbi:hypothetical protein F53441_14292 [Fusarium austroafricanum]|uniref:Uncharacterized protein n=1 Tax=Fusarium austroafricanum TaxID=2364996 RepID=A0A8H4JHG1_9HYPO|nr:hypothetical protein F53441_14292 [Fusarium austroafricanum]